MIVLTGPPFEWEVGTDTAVTIGVFDGVHIGHRRVIADQIALARSSGLDAGILTFDPHPLSILAPERAPLMLTSIDQRVDQFRRLGVDVTGVLSFPDIRQMQPDEFCGSVIHRTLRARQVVVGADFRFGRDRAGDVDLLGREGERLGFVVSVVDRAGDLVGVYRVIDGTARAEVVIS